MSSTVPDVKLKILIWPELSNVSRRQMVSQVNTDENLPSSARAGMDVTYGNKKAILGAMIYPSSKAYPKREVDFQFI